MELRDWLSVVVIVGIVLVIVDGFRRKWFERKRSLKIKLDKNISPEDEYDDDEKHNHELPNGGARPAFDENAPYYGSVEKEGDVPVLMDSVDLENEKYIINHIDELKDTAEVNNEADEKEYEDDSDTEFETFSEEVDDVDEEVDDVDEEVDDIAEGESAEASTEIDDKEAFEALDNEFESYDLSAASERIEPTFGDELEHLDVFEKELKEGLGLKEEPEEALVAENRNQTEVKPVTYTKEDQSELFFDQHEDADDDSHSVSQAPQEVIVINVMSKAEESFSGQALLPVLTKQGLRLGDMSIFHRHSDANGNGPVMFSMANMVKPGTFDITKMEEFTTLGISFFLQMPNTSGNMKSFEQMLSAAKAIKESLGGDLRDEDRNIITRQTLEHSRERIRDFELKQLSNK